MPCPPILMVVFNRPLHTMKVFEEVRKARPPRLYIAVDGPRQGRQDDVVNIDKTMKIFDSIDWECSVQRLVREHNKGCQIAVTAAISWFFENEETGIILEDDCIPSPSFFNYCSHLLEKYKDNESIMHINGVNFQEGKIRGKGTYYFSKITIVWGWASWRRAWKKYDIDMHGLDRFMEDKLYKSVIPYQKSYDEYWRPYLLKSKAGLNDSWDYQWMFTIWKNNGLSVTPNYNLITNVGFDNTATHTKGNDEKVANKPYKILEEKIQDVDVLIADSSADLFLFKRLYVNNRTLPKRIWRKIKQISKLK
jgi:hypothetical protein